MRAFKTVVTALAAAALGAGIALLLAPQSGEKTRRQIRRRVEDEVTDIRDSVNAKAHEVYKRGADRAQYLARRVRRNIQPRLAAVVNR
jgi:gas vesicle protein